MTSESDKSPYARSDIRNTQSDAQTRHWENGENRPRAASASEAPNHTKPQGCTSAVPRLALNVKEACAALGICWDVWREHVEPDIRLVRIGSRKLVPIAELERWLAANAESVLERR